MASVLHAHEFFVLNKTQDVLDALMKGYFTEVGVDIPYAICLRPCFEQPVRLPCS